MVADVVDHVAQLLDEAVDHDRRELELQERLGHLVAQLLRLAIGRAVFVGGFLELRVDLAQLVHAARDLDEVDAGVDRIGLVGFLGVVRFLGFGFGRRFGRAVGHDHFRRLLDIGETGEHFGQALLALGVLVILLEQELDRPREARQRGLHLAEAFLDALGDRDLALAGEQLHRAHLAHVHAHGIGGAAHFGVDRAEHGDRFLGRGVVVGRDRRFGQQRLGIGRNFVHLDAHVVDHADDVFDLLRIDDVVRQVVVDLGVGQVALLLALDDQGLDLGLLLLVVFCGHVFSG